MAYQIRELTIGEVLDQAIAVLKNRFGLLLGIFACAYLPLQLLAGLIQASYVTERPSGSVLEQILAAQEQAQEAWLYVLPIALVQTVIVLPISYGAVVHAIAKEYLHEATSVRDSFRAGASRALPLIWTFILYYFAVVGGTFLCVVPGILFGLWLSLSPEVAVLEERSGFQALKRSRALTRGNVGKVLVLWFLLIVINVLLGGGTIFIPEPYIQAILTALIQTVTFIFGTAAFVILYFSCRSQHEGFDLARLAEAVRAEEGTGGGRAAVEF